jgi:hypothetical protein
MVKFRFESVSNRYLLCVKKQQCCLVHLALHFTSMGNIATYTGPISII